MKRILTRFSNQKKWFEVYNFLNAVGEKEMPLNVGEHLMAFLISLSVHININSLYLRQFLCSELLRGVYGGGGVIAKKNIFWLSFCSVFILVS